MAKFANRFLKMIGCVCLIAFSGAALGAKSSGDSSSGNQTSDGTSSNQSKSSGSNSGSDQSKSGGSGSTATTVTAGSSAGVIESYVLSNKQMKACARAISSEIDDTKSIILFEQTQQGQFAALASTSAQLSLLNSVLEQAKLDFDAMEKQHPFPKDAPPQAALGPGFAEAVSFAQSFLALFQETISIGSNSVNLSDDALIDEVAKAIRERAKADKVTSGVKVRRPSSYFPELLDPKAFENSALKAGFVNLVNLRNTVNGLAQRTKTESNTLSADLKDLAKRISDAEKAKTDTTPLKKQQSDWSEALDARTPILAELQGAISSTDTLLQSLSVGVATSGSGKAPSDTGSGSDSASGGAGGTNTVTTTTTTTTATSSGSAGTGTNSPSKSPSSKGKASGAGTFSLIDLLSAETLISEAKNSASLLVSLHVEQAGGGYETRGSLWTFLGATPVFYSGGIVTSYIGFDPSTGNIVTSGTCEHYSGNRSSSELNAN